MKFKRIVGNGFAVQVTTPYKYGLSFLRDAYIDSKYQTIDPKKLNRKEIFEYGLELLRNNDDWEEIKW